MHHRFHSLIVLLLILSFLGNTNLFAQDFALRQLEDSPRHHEWVKISSGDREVSAFVAFPEVAQKSDVLIVIHENRGLTDWVRSMADQLAELGFIAIAPDLLSDFDDSHSTTTDFENDDEARNAIYKLDPDQVTGDLDRVVEYANAVPAGNGKVSVIGFCWGGAQSFRYATNNPAIEKALVFYGTGPSDASDYARIESTVYGFYGENDQRVNATIEGSEEAMEEYGKSFDYEIYPEAGHAYMRSADDPDGSEANKAAKDASIQRIQKIFKK
ncbi:dienelactone hydrolase family protein [Pleomorphovibrio marinus]|uniref:dienelactone hydrolase family protein n=1 Tax=Pleomorphovibrio marinus TaxID=2164132 RepID=UPI000E0C902F|nr:dienelactone hydrolase family protein [Pleomorphovibrio marinus]